MQDQPSTIRIETQRLVLRMYRAADHEALHAMMAQPAMLRFSQRGAMSNEESWTHLLRHLGHWACCGYGVFAVEEKESGRFVGEAGVSDFRRWLGPSFDPFPESTWSTVPAAQGRGYATEAAAAALAWAERQLGARRTVCLIDEQNAASLRVGAKLGYREFARITYREQPTVLLERGGAAG